MQRIEPIAPAELARRLAEGEELVLLDVREPHELALSAMDGVVAIPLGQLVRRSSELDPRSATVCICHHGIRSAQACSLLARAGFERLFNLTGGIDRWSIEVDPRVPRY